ncbi:MAG: 50S ribosomal protein L18 [Firmicutes bacterium]|nr:50S ribosomal protein L18 [Bacillota bacterium]
MSRRRDKEAGRRRRHLRVRKRVIGSPERPRLSVFRSLKHIYAQIVVDTDGQTVVHASSLDPEIRAKMKHGGNVDAARAVGDLVARKALEKGITTVVFDRGGYLYHGRVRALADAARAAGLQF